MHIAYHVFAFDAIGNLHKLTKQRKLCDNILGALDNFSDQNFTQRGYCQLTNKPDGDNILSLAMYLSKWQMRSLQTGKQNLMENLIKEV
jgi:hypothetical protein